MDNEHLERMRKFERRIWSQLENLLYDAYENVTWPCDCVVCDKLHEQALIRVQAELIAKGEW